MGGNPLIKLDELTKPATVLIEKISDAVGGIFKPYQVIRLAKAEAEAEQIRAESQIQITDLHRRAMHRFLEEEARKQSNIEEITYRALPLLEERARPQELGDDWIANFFDKSRIISDPQMQELWAGVLAREANGPGTFSRKTVNILSDLEKSDADLFTMVYGFAWELEHVPTPIVFDVHAEIYNRCDIHFRPLAHLESLGLIRFDNISGFTRLRLPKLVTASYFGRSVELGLPLEEGNAIEMGKVMPTQAGLELSMVCSPKPVEGFFDYAIGQWKDCDIQVKVVE